MTYGPGATSLSRLLWVILGSIFHAPPVVSEIPMLFVPVLSSSYPVSITLVQTVSSCGLSVYDNSCRVFLLLLIVNV
jgi:branched-subunit amino acid permease